MEMVTLLCPNMILSNLTIPTTASMTLGTNEVDYPKPVEKKVYTLQ